MRRLILQRLALSIPLPFVVSGLTFLLTALTPGDLARSILGGNATQAQVDSLRHQLGLDEPLAVRYWQWLISALHGNLGVSPTTSEPVATVLNARLGVTLSLVIGSTLAAAAAGLLLGTVAAVRGGVLGRLLDVVTLAAPGVAIIARQTRDSMLSTVQRPFMRTLRAAGLPGRSLLLKHALRNA